MFTISNLFADNTSLAVLVLIAILSILWYLTKRSPQPPLPPGPRGLPIVGNLPFLDPDLHTYFTKLSQSHGPIFKLNLGSKLTVVVNSPTLAREILKDQDINFSNRDVPLTARVASYGGLDIVCLPYGDEWRMVRKVCVLKLFSRKTLDSFYELRRKEVRERTRYLYEQSQERSPVKVGDQMFLTMMNLAMNMLWGGSVKAEEMESVGAEFKGVISKITRPNISDFLPWLARFDLQGLVKRMRVCSREVDAILDRAIEHIQRLRSSEADDGQCKDFLQYLMKLKNQESDSDVPLTVNHVKALLADMVIGGTGTSTNTLEFAMAELISKPEKMKRAQEELDEVVGKDNIVEESHITRLPYILAIMKETLRLYPAAPLLIPHRNTETTVVGGYTIPKDTKIFVNAWSIQRDPNFWENPTEFRPERWFLDNNKTCDFTGTDYRFLPFGSGRRICAGVALAERMVLYTLATLVHSFDWTIPEGQMLDLKEKFGLVLKLKTPLVALPVPRLSNLNLYS